MSPIYPNFIYKTGNILQLNSESVILYFKFIPKAISESDEEGLSN